MRTVDTSVSTSMLFGKVESKFPGLHSARVGFSGAYVSTMSFCFSKPEVAIWVQLKPPRGLFGFSPNQNRLKTGTRNKWRNRAQNECGPANLSALLTSAIEEIQSVAFWDLFPCTHATHLGVTVFLTTIPIWLAWEPMGNRAIGSQSPTPAKTACVRCSRAEAWKTHVTS